MKITYDDKSFLLDGQRLWLVAGEIHYFRLPREEWRPALLRAKRAGLNAISTYVAWNFHEQRPGQTDFTGDRDLGHYIDLIGELGMYAMVRPGPYICSEWDGGGLPAWLCAQPVRRFREDDPVYMDAVSRWFDALLPIIAARQVTRCGPVITVQNENEYPGGWDESMRRYLGKLNAMFVRHGIDVHVLACNVHAASATTIQINGTTVEGDQFLDPATILTYNHHTEVEQIRELKRRQPHAPLLVTEFWSGAPLYWGNSIYQWPHPADQARAVYEYTSVGAQVDYYMFEGGTNFGFWGGNNIATTYAATYPVGDGGRLAEKYYAVHPASLFVNQFGSAIADSREDEGRGGVGCPEGARLVVRSGSEGAIAYLSAQDGRGEVALTLPGGKGLNVPLGRVPAAALPLGLKVFGDATVDYSNLCLLGRDARRRALLLHGPAGAEGVVGIDGQEARITVPRRAVVHRAVAGVGVVVADEEMAQRCWIAGEDIFFGPDYVGERNPDGSYQMEAGPGAPAAVRLDDIGRPVPFAIAPAVSEPARPQLGPWRAALCPELGPSEGWAAALDAPRSHERLGVTQGYLWYSAEFESAEDRVETLLLTNTPNRVSVFVNGSFCGTHAERRSVRMRDEYGHPDDWAFEELTVRLQKGRNRFVFLSDDLGHNYDVPVPVGIQGPVFVGSRMLAVTEFRELPPEPVSADGAYFLHCRDCRTPGPLPTMEITVPRRADETAFLVLHGVHGWVTTCGRDVLPMLWPESPWSMFEQIKRWISYELPDETCGDSAVRIHCPGWRPEEVLEHLSIYVVPKSGALTGWHWKKWELNLGAASSQSVRGLDDGPQGPLVLLPVKSGIARKAKRLAPAFFETEFPMPEGSRPVFFHPGQMRKGQIFLNGRNVGRFWQKGGTQERYYLPRAWMGETNKLVVFEELGVLPQGAELTV